jgi:hypothetical protein
MIDWCIKAPDEATAKAVVRASGRRLLDEAGNWILAGENHALDPGIGIESVPAAIGAHGRVTSPAVLEPGWFANLRITDGEDITPLLSAAAGAGVEVKHPATPRRVWA